MKPICALLLALLMISCRPSEATLYLEEGVKRINNADIYYKIMGSGEPIMVVHGGPGLDHSYLLPQMQELAKDHQLIFYDQRASGRSSLEVPAATVSIWGFVEDIEGLRQLLGLDTINIMAHSWGGLIAMNYAINYPDHLKSLILVNSVSASTEVKQQEAEIVNQRLSPEDSIRLQAITSSVAYQNNEPEAFEELYRIMYGLQFYHQDLVDELTLDFQNNFPESSRVLRRLEPDLRYYNYYNSLKSVSTPTLIIYGDYDPMLKLAGSELKASLANSRLEILQECGHFPFIEAPQKFFGTVRDFLAEQ